MKPSILQGHTRPVKAIAFTSDNKKVLSASTDRTIIAWDLDTKEKVTAYSHAAAISSFALSKCGKYLVSGDCTGTVSIWDINLGIALSIIEGDPSDSVRSISFGKDDKYLLLTISGRSKTAKSYIKVYDFENIINISLPEFMINYNSDSKLNKNSNQNSKNNSPTIEKSNLVNLNDGHNIENIYNTESIYSNNKISNNKNQSKKSKKKNKNNINNNDTDNPVLLHVPKKIDFDNVITYKEFVSNESKYTCSRLFKDNSKLLISKENGSLELLDLDTKLKIMEKCIHNQSILDFDIEENMNFVISSSMDGYVCIIGLENFQIYFKFNPDNPNRNINSCKIMVIDNPFKTEKKVDIDDAFNNVDNHAFDDKYSYLRNLTKLPLAIFGGGQDSKLVTTTHGKDGGFEMIIHELIEGRQLIYFPSHFGPINGIGISPKDYNWIASGSEDSTVRLYNIQECLKTLLNN